MSGLSPTDDILVGIANDREGSEAAVELIALHAASVTACIDPAK
jgi:hypothetical protein